MAEMRKMEIRADELAREKANEICCANGLAAQKYIKEHNWKMAKEHLAKAEAAYIKPVLLMDFLRDDVNLTLAEIRRLIKGAKVLVDDKAARDLRMDIRYAREIMVDKEKAPWPRETTSG